jgi:hypothetical protein
MVTDRKNGRILLDRPKPTAGSGANGRRSWETLCFPRRTFFRPIIQVSAADLGHEK